MLINTLKAYKQFKMTFYFIVILFSVIIENFIKKQLTTLKKHILTILKMSNKLYNSINAIDLLGN